MNARRVAHSLSHGAFSPAELIRTDAGPEVFDESRDEAEEIESRHFRHNHRKVTFTIGSSKNLRRKTCPCDGDPDEIELTATKPAGLRLVQSGVDLVRHSMSIGEHRHIDENESHENCGHVMIAATCTRYWGLCETCRKPVHGAKYFYCQNCPVVVHNYKCCWRDLRRQCPAVEMGVYGWGEGNCPPSRNLESQIDLEYVFLGGPPTNHSNACADCGRILYSDQGHPCDDGNDVATRHHLENRHRRRLRALFHHHPHQNGNDHNDVSGNDNGNEGDHCGNRGSVGESGSPVAKKVLACSLTGKLYCERCHWGDKWYIPGNMFVLNDLEKHPISRMAFLKMRILWDSALFSVPGFWLNEHEEAKNVHCIREKFDRMEPYITACSDATDIKEVLETPRAPHLLGNADCIRLRDVIPILKSTLLPSLQEKFDFIDNHIQNCKICQRQSRRCCICEEGDKLVLYADDVGSCKKCSKPYHLSCALDNKVDHECC